MKKTYIQPTTTIHSISVERNFLAASGDRSLKIIYSDNEDEVESGDILSRRYSIWDDEDE